jgi:RNA polymerase sigma-70 factor (ECF subfamily)
MTEQQIAEGCKAGKTEALKALYESYGSAMMGLLVRYISDRETAGDLLHDGYIHAFQSFDKFTWRGDGSLRAWMSRMFVNQALSYLRSSKQLTDNRPIEDLAERIEEPSEDDVTGLSEEVLLRFIEELPTGYQTVFNMFAIDGLSHREIGSQLAISEKSSSSQYFRARQLLARKIKEYTKK